MGLSSNERQRPPSPNGSPTLLELSELASGYGSKRVVFGVSCQVGAGEIVGLIGHNGAGKTTTLRTILGMLRPFEGHVRFKGEDVTGRSCRRNVMAGMAFIPSERFVFADLTVRDNLLLGTLREKSGEIRDLRLKEVHELFPVLKDRAGQKAGTLSGGEQRMLSLGVALMGTPSLLLLDEPSLGIAPALVSAIFQVIRRLASERAMGVLLLEQNVAQLLTIADRVYVMRSGRVILQETAAEMGKRDHYWDLF